MHDNLDSNELTKIAKQIETKLFDSPVESAEETMRLMSLLHDLREEVDRRAGPKGCSVKLLDHNGNKIACIKAIRNLIPGCALLEAKKLTEELPKYIVTGTTREMAEKFKKALEREGASVEFNAPVERSELHEEHPGYDE